ncbi:hypothetical protein BO94DRAFT_617264, partial [Aspergillus sclerotioniger CBS 115572]
IYLNIFKINSQVFVPFILVIISRVCLLFNISKFKSKYTKQETLFSCNKALPIFLDITRKHGLEKTLIFKKLLNAIFYLTPPLTDTDKNKYYLL